MRFPLFSRLCCLRAVSVLFVLFLLLSPFVGCGRESLPFNIAAAGLSLPRLSLNEGNANALLNRVHLLEIVQKLEREQIQPHDLSLYLGRVALFRPPCSSKSCRSCLDGDETTGLIDLTCWTNTEFSGSLRLDAINNEIRAGEAFMDWTDVCSKKALGDSKLCFSGNTGYSVKLDKIQRTARMDLLWTVNLRVTPDGGETTRLDGTMGFVFTAQTKTPAQTRKAVFLQDQSIVYSDYSSSGSTTKVTILSREAEYRCTHNRKAQTGECTLLKAADPNTSLSNFRW